MMFIYHYYSFQGHNIDLNQAHFISQSFSMQPLYRLFYYLNVKNMNINRIVMIIPIRDAALVFNRLLKPAS